MYYGQLTTHILRTSENMILHKGVTQETMEITDLYDTMIPTDIIKAINETAHDGIIAFIDTSYEAEIDP